MNKPEYRTELLQMIWPYQAGVRFVSDMGENVEVVKAGEYDSVTELFAGAEVVVDGVVFRGNVLFGTPDPSGFKYDNCILQVVADANITHILKNDGSFLPQIILNAGAVTGTAYEMLREGTENQGCAYHIRKMESHERVALFTRLLTDRMQRKCNDISVLHEKCSQNWNETMYVMLLRKMGDADNQEAFTELARRVRYGYISRERNSLEHVEALLLGTSGLLELYEDDNYTRTLKIHYEYLRRKYSITAMMPRQWSIKVKYPNSHPVLRIAQTAAFLTTREFLFESLIRCRTVEDIHNFFRAEASDYWSTHYVPSSLSDRRPKRIGHQKANILGINLTVPMQFAYGDYMNNTELKDAALDLLEKIECESYKMLEGWREGGVWMESAFDSQAMIQLIKEHCHKGLCRQCTIGRRVIREVYANEHKIASK